MAAERPRWSDTPMDKQWVGLDSRCPQSQPRTPPSHPPRPVSLENPDASTYQLWFRQRVDLRKKCNLLSKQPGPAAEEIHFETSYQDRLHACHHLSKEGSGCHYIYWSCIKDQICSPNQFSSSPSLPQAAFLLGIIPSKLSQRAKELGKKPRLWQQCCISHLNSPLASLCQTHSIWYQI